MRRRTLRHPFRGDRVYARSAAHRSRRSTRRVRQPRIRPRKSVNVAALVASPEEQPGRPGLRLIIVGLVVVLLFGILILRLWTLQVIDSKNYAAAVSTNSVRVVSVPAPRGQITDRSNTVLVGNQLIQEIVLSRVEATQHPEVIGQVAALVGETPAEVTADVNNPRYSPYQPVPIQSDASPATVQYLETHQSEYPGVSVQQVTQRSYPQQATATQNSVASQVLGYVGDISSTQLAANPNQGYELGSMFGQAGLEGEYEKYLRGTAGQQALEVDSAGDVVGTLRKTQPTPGDTLVTNLDLGLQEQVELALQSDIEADRKVRDHTTGALPEADNGAAVVMDVTTGQVLAMASYPTYDLNDWTGGISQANYTAIAASGAENNNAIQGLYTPGSTFKLATATAALQDGIIGPNTYYNDTGTYTARNCIPGTSAGLCDFKDDDNAGQGEITITGALTASSDAFFYNLGDLYWQGDNRSHFGDTPIQSVAMEYGLGELTGIDLPYEVQGRVDSQATADKLHQEAPNVYQAVTWNAGDNIEMAFGQGGTVVTPISMAQAYATFANGGTRYQPQVANALVDATTGQVVKQFAPVKTGTISYSPANYQAMLQGFLGVVNNPKGTANSTFAQISKLPSNFQVAGKTGTADVGDNKEPNAWFVSFGPEPNPKYVIAVVVDKGGYGAQAAAPAVANIWNYLYANPVNPVVLPTMKSPPTNTPPVTQPPIGTPVTTTTTTPPSSTTTTKPGSSSSTSSTSTTAPSGPTTTTPAGTGG